MKRKSKTTPTPRLGNHFMKFAHIVRVSTFQARRTGRSWGVKHVHKVVSPVPNELVSITVGAELKNQVSLSLLYVSRNGSNKPNQIGVTAQV